MCVDGDAPPGGIEFARANPASSIAKRTGNTAASGIVAFAVRSGRSVDNGRQAGAKVEAANACNVYILKGRRSVSYSQGHKHVELNAVNVWA